MKTYLVGFLILTALYFTGCASHKPLAVKPVTHATNTPLRHPPIHRFIPRPILRPVVHDTIRIHDTVTVYAKRKHK